VRKVIVRCLCIGFFGLLALPGVAFAQTAAYTTGPANLRAGPGRDFPLVAELAPGTPVSVVACLSDYTWCDVALPNLRGWIYAGQLEYPYEGGDALLLDYGETIGLPVEAFVLETYWDRYYRNRPWFSDRDRWLHRGEPRVGPGGLPPERGHPPIEARPGGANGYPGAVRPGAGYPGGGRPEPDHPGTGYPGDGRPGAGYPGAGHPGPGPQGGMRAPQPRVIQPGVEHAPDVHGGGPMRAPGPSAGAVIRPAARPGDGGGHANGDGHGEGEGHD
jgi:uncharacterized protein YraI